MTGRATPADDGWQVLPVAPSRLGDSPFWHPDEGALYWCDIAGRTLNRWHEARGIFTQWALDHEPGCVAPLPGGALLLAQRDGLWRFEPASGDRQRLAAAPYDTRRQRFNDGKADAAGRFWVGTVHEPRDAAAAALYRWVHGRLERVAGGVTVSNGLAFSPDGATMLWSDTSAHRIDALDMDPVTGSVSRRRAWAQFAPRSPGQDLADYGGRPDGAAVDAEGACWVAMVEGQRLLRLAPDGAVLQALALPVRCPTMPCFGGADLRTLFVTTARENRPAAELFAQPLAGRVLFRRVEVPGLPVNFCRG